MKKWMIALACLMAMGATNAKLPPLSDEAKAKAAEAKDKADWSTKIAAYQLCVRQNQVVDYYRKSKGAETKPANSVPAVAPNAAPAAVPGASSTAAPAAIPPCQDPGPYVAAQAAAKVGVADSLPVPAAGKPPAAGEVKK